MREKAALRVVEREAASPANAAKDSSRQSPWLPPQADQVKAAVGTWSQHRVTQPQLPQGGAHYARRHGRRIATDDDRRGMAAQETPEGSRQPLPELPALLPRQGPPARRNRKGECATREKQVARDPVPERVHFADGV